MVCTARVLNRSPKRSGKDLALEGEDLGSLLVPAAGRKAGFFAGIIEEGLCIPAVLGCHLREQKPARAKTPGDKPVPADFDMAGPVFGIAFERNRGGKHRYLEIKGIKFFPFHSREPRVFERGSDSGIFNGFAKRHHRVGKADTATELAGPVQCYKDPAFFPKDRGERKPRFWFFCDDMLYGPAGEPCRKYAFFCRKQLRGKSPPLQ